MDRELIERIVAEVIRRLKGLAEGGASVGGAGVRLVTEELVVETARRGEKEIRVVVGAIVTSLAQDALRQAGIALVEVAGVAGSRPVGGRTLGAVAVGADGRGAGLKEAVKGMVRSLGREVVDCGEGGAEPGGYAAVAEQVAVAVVEGRCETGIVVDGGGAPSAIVANKVAGVRAVACQDVTSARYARAHVDANVLCLGAGTVGDTVARTIVATWLKTPFEEGEYADRVEKIREVERRRFKG